ncbi:unnamed protein product, partial [Aureobasidium pullulans]
AANCCARIWKRRSSTQSIVRWLVFCWSSRYTTLTKLEPVCERARVRYGNLVYHWQTLDTRDDRGYVTTRALRDHDILHAAARSTEHNTFVKNLVPHFVSDQFDSGPLKLICDDLRPGSVLVNEDTLQINGIIDWE